MLDYILKVLLFQTLFLVVYDLMLKRETFFQWNRVYLIVTSCIAYVIPLLKVNQLYEVMPQEYIVLLPEIILTPGAVIKESFSWSSVLFTALSYMFWMGLVCASLLFIKRLYVIVRLIVDNEKESLLNYNLVKLESNSAFSFFNYIFLGKALSEKNKEQIVSHELVHVQQKHSLDLLFFELQKIVLWFNPFSYLFQRRIAELHEFIADSKAVKEIDKQDYFQNLLSQTFGTQKFSFINPFLKFSLIKKRISMLNKDNSKQVLKFKYVLMLPLLIGMLLYSSCEKESVKNGTVLNKNEKRLITLYMGVEGEADRSEIKTKKEGYFDMYMAGGVPNGRQISYDVLSHEEKVEFDRVVSIFNKEDEDFVKFEIFEMKDGKRALLQIVDWEGLKNEDETEKLEIDEQPFATVVKSPIFPGCEDAEDQKQCFNAKLQQFVGENFDISLAKNLGLKPGKKKIFVKFLIDSEGRVVKVKSRAPHKDLESEASRLFTSLPKMEAGEKESGEKVGVTYMLPISFNIQ